MDSGGHFRSLEASRQARLFLWLARHQPGAVQHGTGFAPEAAARQQAAELLCVPLCRSGRERVRQRFLGFFVRGCARREGQEITSQVNPTILSVPHIIPRTGTSLGLRNVYVWRRWGNSIGGLGSILGIFTRPPEAGRIRWPDLLFLPLCFFFLIGLFENDFFLGAENLLAANFHGLDAHHFIAHQPHEIYIMRRFAVDPLLVLRICVPLADFLGSLADGVNHHLTIHADQHVIRLDGLFYFRTYVVE